MHSRREMTHQNGRAHPDRDPGPSGFHRDDDRDRDRHGAQRDDDRERRDGRADRGTDPRFPRFDDGDERFADRGWQGRGERCSGSDRGRDPYAARDPHASGDRDARRDPSGSRDREAMPPRQDQLLRGAYRDHDESYHDLSYRADRIHDEPGPSDGRRDEPGRAAGEAGSARARISQRRGPHHGKGPVGFQRSDERIRELVCEALTDDGEVDATHIEVRVTAGEVTLTGTIDDRPMKRRAEDCVELVPGVRDVHNQLRIGEAPVTQDRSGRGTERAEEHDRHERAAEPPDRKHRPS